MRLILAASTALALVAGAAPLAAQPAPPPAEPAAGAPTVPADSPAAAALPPTAPTVVNNTLPPPPAEAMNKSYPMCTRTLRDSCQNPGEGGAPGRSRASDVKRHHHHRMP